MTTQEILQAAQGAKLPLALADADTKNAALEAMAVALIAAQDKILDANKQDVENARGRVSDVMLDRLALTPSRLTDMAKGMREVAALPDPVGAVLRKIVRPNGLLIEKTAVPMGVIAIIYESRPNVTSDAAALAIKAGSACILRCGRDAWASCHAIVEALRAGLRRVRLPECAVSLIEDTSHASANELMTPRRGRADPRLRRERNRALHPDRHRHLPCLRGQGRRSGDGCGYCGKRQDEPPQRLQRRGGAAGP